jgi:hypothetical protein
MSERPASPALAIVGGVLTALGVLGTLTGLIFGVLGLVFGIAFPAAFGTPWADMQLDRGSWMATGEVTAVSPNPALVVNSHPTVRIDYEFDASGATYVDHVLVVDVDPLAALQPGVWVDVDYLPDDPTVSRLHGAKAEVAGLAGAIGVGLAVVFGLSAVLPVLMLAVGLLLLKIGLRRLKR